MIDLSNVKFNIKEINPVWVYSYYLNIPLEHFNGGGIKILSPFKNERNPSFTIYYKKNKWKFKDFSSGKSGDYLDLVKYLLEYSCGYNIPQAKVIDNILFDYNRWVLNGGKIDSINFIEKPTYQVQLYEKRKWNVLDRDYWLSYHLGSKLLEWGCVHPLSFYRMSNKEQSFDVEGDCIYGYFNKSGELVKIYQPNRPDFKFMNVKHYVAGSEHEMQYNCLLQVSSWKDALSIWNLGIKTDIHVHNSENNNLSKDYLDDIKKRYKFILSLFDNDDTGIKAMKRYKQEYDIDYVYLPLKKDVSDSVKHLGTKYVRDILVPIIDNKINQITCQQKM